MGIKEAAACVRKKDKFLITAHTSPEGDALGSELAFFYLIKALGKDAVIINEDKVPDECAFFPGIEKIRKFDKHAAEAEFDCFVALDCSDLKRTGEVFQLNIPRRTVLNIDHHISNGYFGDVNWVNPKASSCSEMIYQLYKEMKIKLGRRAALLLYAGMVTDTGSFRYSNTTALTHQAAAELLGYGINTQQVYKRLYENAPFEDMRLLSRILPGMNRAFGGKVIWFQVKKEMLENKKTSFDLAEHILSFGRAIKGGEVVVLFKENLKGENEIRVNLRSQGAFDVNKVAQAFGGGGHKAAAGATVKGGIEDVRRMVLRKIKGNLG